MPELLSFSELNTVHYHPVVVSIKIALLEDKQRFGSGGLITLNSTHLSDL